MNCKSNLPHVVRTLDATSGFSNLLDCGKQHRNQDSDDGYHDQQFNKSEARFDPSFGTHFKHLFTFREIVIDSQTPIDHDKRVGEGS